MSYWLVAVPNQGAQERATLDVMQRNTQDRQLSRNHMFRVPQLKVGTLDTLMQLSDDLAKYDTQVGQIAKKIEKTFFDLQRSEDEANKKESASASASSSSASSSAQKPLELEQLKVGNSTSQEYVEKFSWNETRYPKRSPLRSLTDLIIKEANKSDETLKKYLTDFNETRTNYTAIERKDTGSLLVKPLSQYVNERDIIEKGHLTTALLVVPRSRVPEFEATYETMEREWLQKEEAERVRREEERRVRAKEAAERAAKEAAEAEQQRAANAHHEHESHSEANGNHAAAPAPAAAAPAAAAAEDAAPPTKKKLPCNIVVPRSARKLCDDEKDEFVLYRVVLLRDGLDTFKAVCRDRKYTIRPFKFDPAEEKAERERKFELAKKKKTQLAHLLRWCSVTYSEVFSAWIHIKAIRLYVESVLRYGLPVSFAASLLEPLPGKDRQLRQALKDLYGSLAGSNTNLTSSDPNEVDLSGLGGEFYPYVYLPVSLLD